MLMHIQHRGETATIGIVKSLNVQKVCGMWTYVAVAETEEGLWLYEMFPTQPLWQRLLGIPRNPKGVSWHVCHPTAWAYLIGCPKGN